MYQQTELIREGQAKGREAESLKCLLHRTSNVGYEPLLPWNIPTCISAAAWQRQAWQQRGGMGPRVTGSDAATYAGLTNSCFFISTGGDARESFPLFDLSPGAHSRDNRAGEHCPFCCGLWIKCLP